MWQTDFSMQSLNLTSFVMLSELLSTAFADHPVNANEVYACTYRCHPMSHEFSWDLRMEF
jgi:hypothetical protein